VEVSPLAIKGKALLGPHRGLDAVNDIYWSAALWAVFFLRGPQSHDPIF